ncbi:DUF1345 domain-containing protein [Brevundimonas sp.]|uniref:DUF1345 domain-containing protein n=1 Tax=Brevundimonas sp. TaxID=1871086 RepID=UPI002D6D9C3E|nr:DUF1345 domain-containing protein [Brevundimonas sp.]HYC98776.1 DUF1345 domain-containing protein [Brevundimonas sp.]
MKPLSWIRLHRALALALAVAASSLVWPLSASWLSRLALGWDLGVALFLVESLAKVARARTTDGIRRHAAALDEAGPAVLPLALVAALASVAVVIGEAARAAGGTADVTTATLALVTVALSWIFTHVIFAFHYAHAWYAPAAGGDAGGLLFPGGEEPDYWDFLHFSLIIGVAAQTADVQIISKRLRRISTVHSVTAFVFNTVIVALSVNLAVGLLGRG